MFSNTYNTVLIYEPILTLSCYSELLVADACSSLSYGIQVGALRLGGRRCEECIRDLESAAKKYLWQRVQVTNTIIIDMKSTVSTKILCHAYFTRSLVKRGHLLIFALLSYKRMFRVNGSPGQPLEIGDLLRS